MNRKRIPAIAAITLAAALILSPVGALRADAASADGAAQVKSKDEVVYANLGADGAVSGAQVVNHFDVTGAGKVTDYGDFSSVVNLTNTGALTQQGNAVSFDAPVGDFYYQGNLASADLPWTFSITYLLDGVQTPPQELAGKAGKLEIRIATAKNPKANPVFTDNYMLRISVTLDRDKCQDIQAPGATLANAGKSVVAAYTVMTGKDANFTAAATVQDFAMAGIQITAMPFSMSFDLPNTDGMVSDFGQLTKAISDLNNGVGTLADGAAQLKSGADQLRSGSADFEQGLNKLNNGSGSLVGASAQIKGALSQISTALSGGLSGDTGLGDLAQLPQGLSQLAQGLKGISGGLTSLKNGFTPAYQALDAAMAGIPAPAVSQAQIQALYTQLDPNQPSQKTALDALTSTYSAAQTAKGTYDQVKGAFDAVGTTIDTLTGSIDTIVATLDSMSTQIGSALSSSDMTRQLQQLSAGLAQLSSNYAQFHDGLKQYTNGLDKLTAGYAKFHSGLSTFTDGVGGLSKGVADLHGGTTKLSDETADMPQMMQTQIDDLLNEYTGKDFTPVSFTSAQNSNVSLVQFVLKCDEIKAPDVAKAATVVQQQGGFWNRLLALFGGGQK